MSGLPLTIVVDVRNDLERAVKTLSFHTKALDQRHPRPYMVTANLREASRYLEKAMASLKEAEGAQR